METIRNFTNVGTVQRGSKDGYHWEVNKQVDAFEVAKLLLRLSRNPQKRAKLEKDMSVVRENARVRQYVRSLEV